MNTVEDFIDRQEGNQKEILLFLHELLANHLELTPKVRYKIPFYYHHSWICYLNPVKGNKIELAFLRGNELSNNQALLERKGRKQVRGMEFGKVADIEEDALYEILQEAILLDETIPYASKNLKKKE
ncbi:MAG: DUF1801 domain-containing protein [Bacteroidota bacterium]